MKLVSRQCVDFVKGFEGFYSEPYLDIVGVKTLGYGMTGSEIEGLESVTEEQASQLLEDLLNNKYAAPIKNKLDMKGIRLKQNEFDALISMAYNIGTNGLLNSTLFRNVCAGIRDKETITSNFEAWSKAGGQQVYGLLRRRREEAEMFFGSGNEIIQEEIHYIVCYNNDVDKRFALTLAEYLQCQAIDNRTTPFNYEGWYPICVGGGEFTSYCKLKIQGNDRFDTMIKVAEYIKSRR